MAIVTLSQSPIAVGGGIVVSDSFAYRDNRAYALYVDFTSPDFNEIFSYVRIYPWIQPNNGVARFDSRYFDVEILSAPQFLLLPFSNLIDGNGDVNFYMERKSFYVGGGEGTPVEITLSYDDDLSVRTWLG